MRSIRIAAVIFNAPRNRTRQNLDRMDGWVAAARKEGATIVCFPELNITGYGADQGIRDSAEPLPGGTGERLCALAEHHQMVILAGLVEKEEAGKIFASHLVVNRSFPPRHSPPMMRSTKDWPGRPPLDPALVRTFRFLRSIPARA